MAISRSSLAASGSFFDAVRRVERLLSATLRLVRISSSSFLRSRGQTRQQTLNGNPAEEMAFSNISPAILSCPPPFSLEDSYNRAARKTEARKMPFPLPTITSCEGGISKFLPASTTLAFFIRIGKSAYPYFQSARVRKKKNAPKAAAGADWKKREAARQKNPPATANTVYSRFSPSTGLFCRSSV